MASERTTVTSPSMSSITLSESSYSLATLTSATGSEQFEVFDDSSSDEDEIVWAGTELEGDEDFILVPHANAHGDPQTSSHSNLHPRALVQVSPQLEAASSAPSLLGAMARLTLYSPEPVSLNESLHIIMPPNLARPNAVPAPVPTSDSVPDTPTQAKGSSAKAVVSASSVCAPAPVPKKKNRGRKRRRGNKAVTVAIGSYPSPVTSEDGELSEELEEYNEHVSMSDRSGVFGSKLLVESDDESEAGPGVDTVEYEKARSFITSVISNPSAMLRTTYARLTLLQSLIVELGLMSPTSDLLPSSLRSARCFLKSHVFVNIGDYLWARQQGPNEIQSVMFPNKKALLKDLRQKKSARRLTNVGWVKEHGLDVLLVSPFRRY